MKVIIEMNEEDLEWVVDKIADFISTVESAMKIPRHYFETPKFETFDDAAGAKEQLIKNFNTHSKVRVLDLNDLAGVVSVKNDARYGWDNYYHIAESKIVFAKGHWVIDLPQPTLLE